MPETIPTPPVNSYPWHCEGCGCGGIVNVLATTPQSVVYQRMIQAHDDLRPSCNAYTGRKVVSV